MAMKLIVTFIIVNIVLLDAGVFVADRGLRHIRDEMCAPIYSTQKPADISPRYYDSNQFYVVRPDYSIITFRSDGYYRRFYGCDTNGHTYRMWKERVR